MLGGGLTWVVCIRDFFFLCVCVRVRARACAVGFVRGENDRGREAVWDSRPFPRAPLVLAPLG